MARRSSRLWSGAQRRDPVRGGLPRRRRGRRRGARRHRRARGRARDIGGAPARNDDAGRRLRRRDRPQLAVRGDRSPERGLVRAGRLPGRGCGRGGRPRDSARAGLGGLRAWLRVGPGLGRGAARDRRPDRRTARHRGAPAAGPAARRFGDRREPRGSRRLRLPLRSRGAPPRNPVHAAVPVMSASPHGPLRVGIGGPVGSGQTALMEALCKRFRGRYELCAITNDIYTKEDARILTVAGALPEERIMGVETGGCPHTAIREDCSINLAAIDAMARRFPELDLVLIESGGDNLAATFSPELADLTIYVIDVSGGEKIPRKGGPGITRSDLLVINKIDLAPHVGASLAVMEEDARRMRRARPFVFTNLRSGEGVEAVARFVEEAG